jgi:hypothetical protein
MLQMVRSDDSIASWSWKRDLSNDGGWGIASKAMTSFTMQSVNYNQCRGRNSTIHSTHVSLKNDTCSRKYTLVCITFLGCNIVCFGVRLVMKLVLFCFTVDVGMQTITSSNMDQMMDSFPRDCLQECVESQNSCLQKNITKVYVTHLSNTASVETDFTLSLSIRLPTHFPVG